MHRRLAASAAAALLLVAGLLAAAVVPAAATTLPAPGAIQLSFVLTADDGSTSAHPAEGAVDALPGRYATSWVAQNPSTTDTVGVHLAVDGTRGCDAVLAPGASTSCDSLPVTVTDGSRQPRSVTATVTSAGGASTDAAGAVEVAARDGGLTSSVGYAAADGTERVLRPAADGTAAGAVALLAVGAPLHLRLDVRTSSETASLTTRFTAPGDCASIAPTDLSPGVDLECAWNQPQSATQNLGIVTVWAEGVSAVDGSRLATRVDYAYQGDGSCSFAKPSALPGETQSLVCTGFEPGLSVLGQQLSDDAWSRVMPVFTSTVAADGTLTGDYVIPLDASAAPARISLSRGGQVLWETERFTVSAPGAQDAATAPAAAPTTRAGTPARAAAPALAATGATIATALVVGGVAALVLIAGAVLLILRNRRRAEEAAQTPQPPETPQAPQPPQ